MSSRADHCQLLSERAFELVRPNLPARDAEVIRSYVYDHAEWGLGIETLVDVLLEESIAVSPEQKQAIVTAMEAMGLDRRQGEIDVTP